MNGYVIAAWLVKEFVYSFLSNEAFSGVGSGVHDVVYVWRKYLAVADETPWNPDSIDPLPWAGLHRPPGPHMLRGRASRGYIYRYEHQPGHVYRPRDGLITAGRLLPITVKCVDRELPPSVHWLALREDASGGAPTTREEPTATSRIF